MGEAAPREAGRRRASGRTGSVLRLEYFRPPAAEDPPSDRLPLADWQQRAPLHTQIIGWMLTAVVAVVVLTILMAVFRRALW